MTVDGVPRCECGHFPVMHAGSTGRCLHGPHSSTETGCSCTEFRTAPMRDTNDARFTSSNPTAEPPALLGVPDSPGDQNVS